MKKIFATIIIAAIALVSCSKSLESISIDPESATMKVGETRTLSVNYNPAKASNKPEVVWTSSNTSIATVSNGVVTTTKAGTVVITATAGEFTATCSITVENDVPIVGDSKYSLIGTFLGTDWHTDYNLAEIETNIYVVRHVTLIDTDKFKVRYNGSWDSNRGGTFIELGKGFAVTEHGEDIIPGLNGTYDIWYNKTKEQMAVVVKDGTPIWE